MANYDAWNLSQESVPINGQSELLRYLIRYAVLAPSSHNSQPWEFTVFDGGIGVYLSSSRMLPIGDPENRLSLISVGAAIENILTATRALGLKAEVSLEKAPGDSRIATILISGMPTQEHNNKLLDAITYRVSERGMYKNTPPSIQFIKQIKEKGQFPMTNLFIIDNEDQKLHLAEEVIAASIRLMDNVAFRRELSLHVLPNSSAKAVGMPASGMGIPDLVSYLVPFLLRTFNMQRLSKNKDLMTLTKGSPALFIITTKDDSLESKLQAGMQFEYISLLATMQEMRTAVWGAATVDEVAPKKIQRMLGTREIPQLFFRVGYPEKESLHSPRLSNTDVIKSV